MRYKIPNNTTEYRKQWRGVLFTMDVTTYNIVNADNARRLSRVRGLSKLRKKFNKDLKKL